MLVMRKLILAAILVAITTPALANSCFSADNLWDFDWRKLGRSDGAAETWKFHYDGSIDCTNCEYKREGTPVAYILNSNGFHIIWVKSGKVNYDCDISGNILSIGGIGTFGH